MDNELFLNDIWDVYFHNPFDNNWNNESYERISTISSVNQFWSNMNHMKKNTHKGIFFIMRQDIFPCWDDPNNIKGGCLSIKILKDNVYEIWEELCIKLLGETLLKPEFRHNWNLINGISTSPKKHFCIIKIWIKDEILASREFFNISATGEILYKSNMDNIHQDNHEK